MYSTANRTRIIGLAVTTAMAAVLLSGCTTIAPRTALGSQAPQATSTKAQSVALRQAEAAVNAAPHAAEGRAALGNAYLDLGRFASAETSFADAQALGDSTPRTALSRAVSLMGQGKLAPAAVLLQAWSDRIPAADSGLALALAGEADLGIALMSNAIRAGQSDAKLRQNLAYGYAIAGRWREARLMAEQDLHGEELDARLGQFAAMIQPDAWQVRIASLLGVPSGVNDPGQPVQLALSATPAPAPAAAAEAATQVAASTSESELPALAAAVPAALELPAVETPVVAVQTAPAPVEQAAEAEAPALAQSFATAFLAPMPVATPVATLAQDSSGFSENRVAKVQRALAVTSDVAAGTHLVQLGSFGSEQGAKRAWKIYAAKYPELKRHQMVISQARVRGKNYWRVSAAGYGKTSSASLCGRVKSGGAQCFAYAEGRPLPGAVDSAIRFASR